MLTRARLYDLVDYEALQPLRHRGLQFPDPREAVKPLTPARPASERRQEQRSFSMAEQDIKKASPAS